MEQAEQTKVYMSGQTSISAHTHTGWIGMKAVIANAECAYTQNSPTASGTLVAAPLKLPIFFGCGLKQLVRKCSTNAEHMFNNKSFLKMDEATCFSFLTMLLTCYRPVGPPVFMDTSLLSWTFKMDLFCNFQFCMWICERRSYA